MRPDRGPLENNSTTADAAGFRVDEHGSDFLWSQCDPNDNCGKTLFTFNVDGKRYKLPVEEAYATYHKVDERTVEEKDWTDDSHLRGTQT